MIGALVAVPELQAEGPARLLSQQQGFAAIKFLGSGAEMTQEARQIMRYALMPGTRIVVDQNGARVEAVVSQKAPQRDQASGLLVYTCDNIPAPVREDNIVALQPIAEPIDQLTAVSFHDLKLSFAAAGTPHPPEPWGPNTFSAREELLRWRDTAWSTTAGVIALAGARVQPLPHQLLTARRVLADRQIRFLLADEVGLGKTIEAGLIMQSLLAMQPNLRVLVIVPGALVSQWFLELYVKFGGRSFLMLDGERVRSHAGNPWASEQFVIASSRAIEDLDTKSTLRFAQAKWDLVIVDECHRMHASGVLYKRVAVLSKSTPHVLLLSATPARQHAEAYLALLSLLQPTIYRNTDLSSFLNKFSVHDQVVDLLTATVQADFDAARKLSKKWKDLLGADPVLSERAEELGKGEAPAKDRLIAHVREHYRLDHRIIRHRRHVLTRLAEASGVKPLTLATRSGEKIGYEVDAAEMAVRQALAAYRECLVGHFAKDRDKMPARLAHWLLQVELGVAHPAVLDRLLAMRATVLAAPEDFVEYRERARPSETVGQVLRNDLSENEALAHVAVSAACNCDAEAEPDVLKRLRESVSSWNKSIGKTGTARIKALIKRLKDFWQDHPQEKVLVFTSHSLAVAQLSESLGRAFGEEAVETFGAHQDTIAREEAARRFRDSDHCPIMVCDPLGGEGRNFQFVSVIVHHDLPWSVAAVEQRIGRVDRLGRDGDVPSWILAPEGDHVDSEWATLLEQAFDVFNASSSGLEFVAEPIEIESLEAFLRGGAAAVRKAAGNARDLVKKERESRDQREDELFHEESATYAEAARVAQTIAEAPVPIEAILRWTRGMGGSAKREEEQPRATKLRTRYHDNPERGVFDRDTALAHPDLAFFALGNGTIDRLIDDAAKAHWCRAMGWRRKPTTQVAQWDGLRVTFEYDFDLSAIIGAGLPIEVLRRLYLIAAPKRTVAFFRCKDGARELDEAVLHLIRPLFDARNGDVALSLQQSRDLWTRPLLSGTPDKVVGWQDSVRRAHEAITKFRLQLEDSEQRNVAEKLSRDLSVSVAVQRGIAAVGAARFGPEHAEAKMLEQEAELEGRQAEALIATAKGMRIAIAGVAYIAVA